MAERERRGEEEYHFSELEDTDVYGAPSPEIPEAPPKRGGGMFLRNLFVLIFLIVAGVFAYRYLAKLNIPKEAPPAPTTTQAVTPPPAPQPVEEQPAAPVQPTVRQQDIDDLNTKATRIEQTVRDLNSDMENTRNRLGQIESTVSTLNTRLGEISTSLQAINEQLKPKKPPIEIGKPVVLPKAAGSKVKKVRRVFRVPYQVKAVIPGRAWLMANDGRTLTVGLGTPISGYGYVRIIDAQRERVVMSSGYVFRRQE